MIFKVSFDFDVESQQVLDLKVVRDGEVEHQVNTTEIRLAGTTLQLHQAVLKDLGVRNNDRLAVVFEYDNGEIIATLVNPKLHPVVGDGSRVTNKFTIVVKGSNLNKLKAMGGEYAIFHSLKLERGVVKLIPTGVVSPPKTKEPEAEEPLPPGEMMSVDGQVMTYDDYLKLLKD